MKFKYIYIILSGLISILILFPAFSSNETDNDAGRNDKILKFSHSLHSDITDCQSCHTTVLESKSLSDRFMPGHDNCQDCHDVEDSEQCNTCHYEDVFEPLIQRESDLYFSHKFHIADQKLDCQVCHKGINEVDYAFQAIQTNPFMEDCYNCHSDRNIASNACESCHTATADLIPQSHRSSNFITSHKFSAKELDANCVMCHDVNNNSCIECHASTTEITESNTADDFYMPYSPNNFIDGSKKQKINRVHELNYRFTHGIDAKGKTTDCQSCHQVETFCASCHQSENRDFALGGIVPASHLKPNFFTIGAGTGGGEHADLARRDIESCVSCHDTQGADPTCITCHLDSDGIAGTNPKTHQRNFMRDIKGDWHESNGSVCYNCHTSASPSSIAGVGFCGYCHGSTN